MIQCPVCNGERVIRGPLRRTIWFDCGLCEGTGEVSEPRFQYRYDRRAIFEIKDTEKT